jgi:hypothetical protein
MLLLCVLSMMSLGLALGAAIPESCHNGTDVIDKVEGNHHSLLTPDYVEGPWLLLPEEFPFKQVRQKNKSKHFIFHIHWLIVHFRRTHKSLLDHLIGFTFAFFTSHSSKSDGLFACLLVCLVAVYQSPTNRSCSCLY